MDSKPEDLLGKERNWAEKYLGLAGVIVVAIDANQRVTLINKTGCEVLGLKREEVIGRNWFDEFIPEEIRDQVRETFAKLMIGETVTVEYFENPVKTKDKKERVILWHNTIMRDDVGNVTGTLSFGTDVTERKKAEEALRGSEEKFRLTFENAHDAIFWADPNTGLIINCNKAAEILLERNREEIIGRHQTILHPSHKAEYYADMFRKHLKRESVIDDEAEVITKSGEIKNVHISAVIMRVGGELILQGTFRDITERRRAEQILKEREGFGFEMLDNLPNPVIVLNPDVSIKYLNPAFEKLSGFSSKLLVGSNTPYPWWLKESSKETRKEFEEYLNSGSKKVEKLFRRKNGEQFWVEWTSVPVKKQGLVRYYLISWVDITDLKRKEAKG